MRHIYGEAIRRWRIDGVPTPFSSSGSGEALQHRGAEIEVRLERNDEKSAQWWCSPRKGSAVTFPHDTDEVDGSLATDADKRRWGVVGVSARSGRGKKRVWRKRNMLRWCSVLFNAPRWHGAVVGAGVR
jgi:hypothetical protein